MVWTVSAMSAPLAIYAGKTSWEWILTVGIVCTAAVMLVFRFGSAEYGKVLQIMQLIILAMVAGTFSKEAAACWGEESVSMPLVLLALAALSAGKSAQGAARVCCCVAWIGVIIYALLLVVGVKNIQWSRVLEIGYFNEMIIIIYLFPVVWLLLPAQKLRGAGLPWTILFGLIISVLCFGTLSAKGVEAVGIPFYQYSKSLTMLGIAERFEAAASVALTLGVFCALSLLLCAAEEMIKHGAVIAAVIAALNVRINSRIMVISVVFAWIILPLLRAAKKVEKR